MKKKEHGSFIKAKEKGAAKNCDMLQGFQCN